jgi:4-hydroxy-4-methyl-2-oxoglutarate aldolase
MKLPLTAEQLEPLRLFDTCTVANVIETFNLRLRNEGFTNASIRCLAPRLRPMVGYAVTATIRASHPPPDRHHYLDRTDWWNFLLTIPAPRVVVLQDLDEKPGTGSLLGEVHANILLALKCTGAVTNGAVRDLPAVQATGFHLFAGNVAVSHSYVHIVNVGVPVEVGGLKDMACSPSRWRSRRTFLPWPPGSWPRNAS